MSKGSEHIEDLERFRNRKEEVQSHAEKLSQRPDVRLRKKSPVKLQLTPGRVWSHPAWQKCQ